MELFDMMTVESGFDRIALNVGHKGFIPGLMTAECTGGRESVKEVPQIQHAASHKKYNFHVSFCCFIRLRA
jgi:hypothetical protein